MSVLVRLSLWWLPLLSISSLAHTPPPEKVLQFGVAVTTNLAEEETVFPLLQSAYQVLNAAKPSGYSIQFSEQSQLDFIIEVTDRKKAAESSSHPGIKKMEQLNGDGYSVYFTERPGSPVVVRVFWDEVMFERLNGKWAERLDAFTRLCVLLGHEIFGNVVYFKEHEEELQLLRLFNDEARSQRFWLEMERNAFLSGMAFIKRFMSVVGGSLPEKMKNDFLLAYAREEEALRHYEKKLGLLPDDPCNGIFSAN